MKRYITVFINGEPFNCNYLMSIKDLLLYLDFNLDIIIVECNEEIISPSFYSNYFLNMNDNLEIVTIVGGG